MPASAIVEERTVRRISPLFFVAAIVCFFFTFAGVSCNTDAAKTTLNGVSALGGAGAPANSSALTKCVDALKGVNIASYSGFNLVFGSSPSVLSSAPSGCPNSSGSGLPSSGSDINLGVQPLAVAGFAAIALALLVSEFGFFGLLRAPFRGVLTTLLAVAGLVTILLEQGHVSGAITSKVSTVTAGSGSTFNVASYFIVNNGIAYYAVIGVLGAAALYNAICAFFTTAGPEPDELPPPEMGLPPPSGMRSTWPGLTPAGGLWRRSARGRKEN
jgi:hypothetical protein